VPAAKNRYTKKSEKNSEISAGAASAHHYRTTVYCGGQAEHRKNKSIEGRATQVDYVPDPLKTSGDDMALISTIS